MRERERNETRRYYHAALRKDEQGKERLHPKERKRYVAITLKKTKTEDITVDKKIADISNRLSRITMLSFYGVCVCVSVIEDTVRQRDSKTER
jgi:hypothetical protein